MLRPKTSCVYCNMSGKICVGRSVFYFIFFSTQTTEMHILAVIMLHQHKFCVYNGKRKVNLLITCVKTLYCLRFNSFYFAL